MQILVKNRCQSNLEKYFEKVLESDPLSGTKLAQWDDNDHEESMK